ncbi:ABC transporter permease [Cognaticolwellia mytili]|uniref:ABC transporter permease n=1 Tax=Cognaticolwellia mytili TaxID=1888913 RepID=UPI001F3E6D60|nr:FtsX-like permease family protein [Cognaticolwellia mytili]
MSARKQAIKGGVMLINNSKLAWHFYQQEYRSPHQRLLRWTQGILLLFIITLGQTSESIQSYLNDNLQSLLGADAVLSQATALTSKQQNELTAITNNLVQIQEVKTTLTHEEQWQRTKLKAVDAQYPLQGQLLTSTSLNDKETATFSGPKQGHIWLDARLLAGLSINIGDYLQIANQTFLVARILHHEPDRLMEGHNVDMRAMINSRDITSLGFAPDLIHYRYLIAATDSQIETLITWQQENLPAAQVHHKQGNHPLALFWKRTENFMGLASILLFFMAAIAINQLTQVHIKKDQYFSAICMSLGATKSTGIQVSMLKWLFGLLLIIPIVLALSAISHWLIINWINETFAELTWQWHLTSMASSILAVAIIFAIFHAPVWLSLRNNSVAKLFTGNQGGVSHWLGKLSSLVVLAVVVISYSDNALLTLMMITAIAFTIVIMIVISWSSLTLGEKLCQNFSGLIPFSLFMMKQRLVSKSTQILGVGLSAFLLLFTLMLMKDLGATMASYQRQHDGNIIVSQATKPQMDFIEHWAEQHSIDIRQAKPFMYAKLIAVNKQSLAELSNKPSDSLATFSRAIRLHWSEAVPKNNAVVNGQWWQNDSQNWQQISLEEEVMTDLGLALGDWLTFFIGQQQVELKIVASHVFKPGAGSITFWVQMPPAALAHIQSAHYSMASIELTQQQQALLPALWQKFPTLRMVSLKEVTKRFDSMLAMITKVISGFSLMIIILASVVILASINALESQEKKKNSIIMSFGFTRKTCLKLNIIEWLVTANVTAIGAILGTYFAGVLIYQSQFSLTYQPDFIWLFATLAIILSVVTSLGIYASRHSLQSSVKQLMSDT